MLRNSNIHPTHFNTYVQLFLRNVKKLNDSESPQNLNLNKLKQEISDIVSTIVGSRNINDQTIIPIVKEMVGNQDLIHKMNQYVYNFKNA